MGIKLGSDEAPEERASTTHPSLDISEYMTCLIINYIKECRRMSAKNSDSEGEPSSLPRSSPTRPMSTNL